MDAKQLSDGVAAVRTAFQALDGIAARATEALAAEREAHAKTAAALAAASANAFDPNVFAGFAIDVANIVNDMNEAANRHAVALQG